VSASKSRRRLTPKYGRRREFSQGTYGFHREHARNELTNAIRIIELDQNPVGVEHIDAPHLPTGVQE